MSLTKKQIISLRKKVEKDFGKKCKDLSLGCLVCQAGLAMDILEDLYEVGWKTLTKKPKTKTK